MAEKRQIKQYYSQCICMVKKIKKKIKTTIKIMSFCHFGLEVLVYITLG
jgi:hypothetical protein